ncbi:MAG: SbcC/MukB-like Walker B domain-containing protein [Umezawaea sp.]
MQLQWEPDPTDPDASTVVAALSQGYQLSPARQEIVRAFLARKIDIARADTATGGSADWRQQLSSALDYRGWLEISLQYRDGSTSRWTQFDAAKHGAKSGSEKVVLLSQPLFAAAVVAYNAAGGNAPRCVWLDEAMTGVDEEIKSSFMGVTVGFDLDVMLTAHDEWCKYPTVAAVAVYDLARHKGLPGVDAVPYLWCGGEWSAVALPVTDVRAAEAAPSADGLFAEADVDR